MESHPGVEMVDANRNKPSEIESNVDNEERNPINSTQLNTADISLARLDNDRTAFSMNDSISSSEVIITIVDRDNRDNDNRMSIDGSQMNLDINLIDLRRASIDLRRDSSRVTSMQIADTINDNDNSNSRMASSRMSLDYSAMISQSQRESIAINDNHSVADALDKIEPEDDIKFQDDDQTTIKIVNEEMIESETELEEDDPEEREDVHRNHLSQRKPEEDMTNVVEGNLNDEENISNNNADKNSNSKSNNSPNRETTRLNATDLFGNDPLLLLSPVNDKVRYRHSCLILRFDSTSRIICNRMMKWRRKSN
jgi:hypothetical protein